MLTRQKRINAVNKLSLMETGDRLKNGKSGKRIGMEEGEGEEGGGMEGHVGG